MPFKKGDILKTNDSDAFDLDMWEVVSEPLFSNLDNKDGTPVYSMLVKKINDQRRISINHLCLYRFNLLDRCYGGSSQMPLTEYQRRLARLVLADMRNDLEEMVSIPWHSDDHNGLDDE